MFILDESEIYYMSDIRKLLEQDRLEFEADQKIKNLEKIFLRKFLDLMRIFLSKFHQPF